MTKGASRAAFVTALVLLAGAAGALTSIQKMFQIQIQKAPIYPEGGNLLAGLPTETDSWVRLPGTVDRREEKDVEETLGTKNYVSRSYVLKSSLQKGTPIVVQFHAAYYTGMIEAVPHVPERCFVGGGMVRGDAAELIPLDLGSSRWQRVTDVPPGVKDEVWQVRSSGGVYVHLPRDPKSIRLRTTRFLNQGKDLYAGYFFVANGGTVSNAEEVRLLAFDLNSYYAYFMKVQVTSESGIASTQDLARYGGSLIGELMGDIMLCAPDWVKVDSGEYPADNPKRKDGAGAKADVKAGASGSAN